MKGGIITMKIHFEDGNIKISLSDENEIEYANTIKSFLKKVLRKDVHNIKFLDSNGLINGMLFLADNDLYAIEPVVTKDNKEEAILRFNLLLNLQYQGKKIFPHFNKGNLVVFQTGKENVVHENIFLVNDNVHHKHYSFTCFDVTSRAD